MSKQNLPNSKVGCRKQGIIREMEFPSLPPVGNHSDSLLAFFNPLFLKTDLLTFPALMPKVSQYAFYLIWSGMN